MRSRRARLVTPSGTAYFTPRSDRPFAPKPVTARGSSTAGRPYCGRAQLARINEELRNARKRAAFVHRVPAAGIASYNDMVENGNSKQFPCRHQVRGCCDIGRLGIGSPEG